MSRFALRNQSKIESHFDKEVLDRILKSLKEYFKTDVKESDIHKSPNDKYKTLSINDAGHTCGLIVFYILDIKYDVYRLAFSEIIT